jgi:UDP-N-acetyl-D-glucosamine dehydrogenase
VECALLKGAHEIRSEEETVKVKKAAGQLEDRINKGIANVGVIGMGYVGLPLAMEFVRAGFRVVGFDIDKEKIKTLNAGKSHIQDVESEAVKDARRRRLFKATGNFAELKKMDSIHICVPTPLGKTRDPNVSYIVAAVGEIAKNLSPGKVIVLESTTYPGTTEEVVLPMLEETGYEVGVDFFLAFSPERVDPGNEQYVTRNIPKVVGGVTPRCTRIAATLYGSCVDTVVPVSSTKVAEMVKLLENTFRSVNIGLVNEIALMSDKLGIDVWEVIDAAATKPFGFMPFYPGPGLGGHCIPIDPFYLSWKAKLSGFEARFIELAGQINSSMPDHVIKRVTEALNTRRKSIKGASIVLLGVAYKSDIDDIRESPALEIMQTLSDLGAKLSYIDPYIPSLNLGGIQMKSKKFTPAVLGRADCVVVVTAHSDFDYTTLAKSADLLVDTRNALKGKRGKSIFRL